jgi:electron transport complex protein RnfD
MSLMQRSSPHVMGRNTTSRIMLWVIVAALPGLLALSYFYGWGYLINTVICVVSAVLAEAAILMLRKRPVLKTLKDASAVLTGVLLGVTLPPFAPWWIMVIASGFAMVFVKHLYGGLGQNLFNPAMAAFALVLISFPLPMTTSWSTPEAISGEPLPSFSQQLSHNLEWQAYDGITMATPLDHYKTKIKRLTADELAQTPEYVAGPFYGILWVNLAFLLGGLLLLFLKIISWHGPVGLFTGLLVLALPFSADADSAMPVLMHLFAGATVFGAFFIVTDPASSATSNRGKFIFGFGVGILTYCIRTWGNFPDAIAFAVLLMNISAPFIDHYTRPRTYGKPKPVSGYKLPEESP